MIKKNHPALNPLYIFISPPSLASLKTRLTGRGTETDESMNSRLQAAIGELEYAKEAGSFDLVVVNDELERAYAVLRSVIVDGKRQGDELPKFDA